MGIVIDMQREALDSNSDVVSLLRKAHVVARKLGLKEFGKWVNNELDGYASDDQIPDYRIVEGEIRAWNPMRGWIPVLVDSSQAANSLNKRAIIDSVTKIQSSIKDENNYPNIPLPPEMCITLSRLSHYPLNYTKFTVFLDKVSLFEIIQKVKNAALDWSITLEENGIVGEGLQFTESEKCIAKEVPQIINYTSNFFGAVSNSQVQQGSNNSKQEN